MYIYEETVSRPTAKTHGKRKTETVTYSRASKLMLYYFTMVGKTTYYLLVSRKAIMNKGSVYY